MATLNPHRPEWVRWIPAAILLVVIVGAVLVAAIMGPRLAAGPGPAGEDQVTDLNWSVFTEQGLRFIDDARTPRIDLSSPPVDAVELGLPADGSLTVGPHPTGLDYRLAVSERVPDLGFTAPPARDLAQAISDARESGRPEAVRSDTGSAAGMDVVAEVTCFGAGFCQVSYLVTPQVG